MFQGRIDDRDVGKILGNIVVLDMVFQGKGELLRNQHKVEDDISILLDILLTHHQFIRSSCKKVAVGYSFP